MRPFCVTFARWPNGLLGGSLGEFFKGFSRGTLQPLRVQGAAPQAERLHRFHPPVRGMSSMGPRLLASDPSCAVLATAPVDPFLWKIRVPQLSRKQFSFGFLTVTSIVRWVTWG